MYGMAGVGGDELSEGAQMLIKAVDSSSKPLCVQIAAILGEALRKAKADLENFTSEIRVYSISD
jgi:hypothetical protein